MKFPAMTPSSGRNVVLSLLLIAIGALIVCLVGACVPTPPIQEPPPRREPPTREPPPPQISAETAACLQQLPEVTALPTTEGLPPLLTHFCGKKPVKDAHDWTLNRRAELLGLFSHYVYGLAPSIPEDMKVTVETSKDALGGTAIRKRYSIQPAADGPILHLLVYIPNKGTPAPVVLGLNFFGNHAVIDDPTVPLSTLWVPSRGEGVVDNKATEAARGTVSARWAIAQNIQKGYATATLYHGDIDLDQPDGENWVHQRFGATEAIRKAPESGGTINAWSWGLSRALDALAKDPDIDSKRIWVMGHSRNGKAALLAAARDTRFAGVISNQSGSMGAAVNRGKTGETIKTIQPFFPHWFNAVFPQFVAEPNQLPVDQHLLLALIAPRPLLVATATGDTWSDPPSAWRSLLAAQPAWTLLGDIQALLAEYPPENKVTGQTIAFHRRPGGHSVTLEDWAVFIAFAEQHKGK